MIDRVKNQLKFKLELLILRGPLYRLLAVAMLLAVIALSAGGLVFWVGDAFGSFAEAVWWAFLRLTDPGYLGDDRGRLLRSVSTVVTVGGYVIFLGALVAIMTQWFHQTMNRLQAGLTPIVQRQHILVLGWTNRTATIVRELFHSEGRVQRFLKRRGTTQMRVVLLSEEDPAVVAQELSDHLGRLWEPARFIIRSGSPQRADHLERVDYTNAAVILLPASELQTPLETTVDGNAITTLITIGDGAREAKREPPYVVAEIMDVRKAPIARQAYSGPIEVIPSDEMLSRLFVQNLRHRGLSYVYAELLGHAWGNEIYLRECPALTGARFGQTFGAFSKAIPIGLLRWRNEQLDVQLNPAPDSLVQQGDRLVLVAQDYEQAAPDGQLWPVSVATKAAGPDNTRAAGTGVAAGAEELEVAVSRMASAPKQRRRILILGWNHRVPSLIRELEGYVHEAVEVDIVSRTPAGERDELMERLDVKPRRVRCCQVEEDYTSPSDLARCKPTRYDNVLLLASDWNDAEAPSDARTILGYLVLQAQLHGMQTPPHILVELLNPDSVGLLRHKPGELLVSPVLVSHNLTQVALRRELWPVFSQLFGSEGAEIGFRPLEAESGARSIIAFDQVQRMCAARGEIALGLRLASASQSQNGLLLNPPRDGTWRIEAGDEVVVLSG
jgi:hypothetical protein